MPVPQRDQVEDIQPAPQIIPEAHPTDQYAAPIIKPPPDNEMVRDISSALSQLNPKLQDFAGIKEYQFTKQDLLAGAALRTKNQGDWKKAVDSGQVPPGASPWFRMGYDRMDMEMQSQQYDAALKQAYQSSSARNSDDPQKLQDWVKGFQGEWLKNSGADKNPMFNQTAAPLMARSEMHLQQIHAQDRIQDYEVASQDKLGQLVSSATAGRMLYPEGGAEKAIQGFIDDAYKHGMPGNQANRIAAEAVARQATIDEDMSKLKMLDNINGGSGPLSGTAWGKEIIKSTQQAILDKQRQQQHYDQWDYERKKALMGDRIVSEGIDAVAKDPQADISQLVADTAKYDPESLPKLLSARKALQEVSQDNPRVLNALEDKITAGTITSDDWLDAVGNNQISAEKLVQMRKEASMALAHADMLKHPAVEALISDLGKEILGSDSLMAKYNPTQMTKVTEAKNALRKDLIAYKEANPKATIDQVLEHGEKLQRWLGKVVGDDANEKNADNPAELSDDLLKKYKVAAPNDATQPKTSTPSTAPSSWQTKAQYESVDELKADFAKAKGDPAYFKLLERQGINPQDYFNSQFKLLSQPKAAAAGGAK